MDGTKPQHIVDRHQQAHYANYFFNFNFYDHRNLKQWVIEKIWKFKDNLKWLIRESDGGN